MNGLTLAYLGDGYLELLVRKYLIDQGLTKVDDLHKNAIHYTSGEAQSAFVDFLLTHDILTQEEIEIFKKGRNNASSYRKNISLANYQKATGFEAIIGFLYINNVLERIDFIFKKMIAWRSQSGKE